MQPSPLKNILVAIDFFDFSKLALNYAITLAEKFTAAITLIHVVEAKIVAEILMITTEMEVDPRIVQGRKEILECLKRDKIGHGILSEAIVRTGEAWEQIIEEAASRRSELIITATHGHSAWRDIYLGNTAERVVRHSPCSVLTVRKTASDKPAPTHPAIRLKRILVPVDFSVASKNAAAE